ISLRSSPTLPTSLYQSCDLSVGGPSLLTWVWRRERGCCKMFSVSHCLEAGPAKAWAHSCTGSPRGRTGWGSRACEALGKGMGLGGRGGMGFRSICAIRKVLRSFFLEGTLSSLSLFLDLGLEEGPTRAQEKVATWGCPRDSCQCLQPTSRSLEFGEWG
uniref:Integral membrane protein 2C n=1 Tax=Pan troglodytes TaxID=9598 RepID=A0A2I3S2L8_PANTR